MGVITFPPPVKLFCGLLLSPTVALEEVEAALTPHYGPVVLRSPCFPFDQTIYYEDEMGRDLQRCYIAFEPLIDMAALAAIKQATNRLEMEFAAAGQRRVNIDPGYVDMAKVVLASTKDHAHRLYIGAGIFAEITLRYWQKRFQFWEWTYPDYRLPVTLEFFHQLRNLYRLQLRQDNAPPSC